MRILLYYRSYHNSALTVSKFPYYAELLNITFPDSTAGVIDRYFSMDYNMKIVLDFSFEVEKKFIIDTLKVFRKVKD
jgi:ABC-type methionine transport system permease subunit